MSLRLGILVSHPIPTFAPWFRAISERGTLDCRVFFCCNWGLEGYLDPQFQTEVKWDVPLLDGYAHTFLPIAATPKRLRFREVDNPQAAAEIAAFDPQVLMLFGYAHRTNWRVARYAAARGIPVLLFSDSSVKQPSRWHKQLLKQLIVRRFYRHVDAAFAVSEANAQYHLRYGLPKDRLFTGMFPLDCARLLSAVPDRAAARKALRAKWSIPEDAFVVLLCGKYVPHKRPQDLAIACQRLQKQGVWGLFVGEGPMRPELERISQEMPHSNITLTGFVNQSEISACYAAADLLALPSSLDAYGLVVPEATCFGLPIVCSEAVGCVGPTDVARPGVNALTFNVGNVEKLASLIGRIQGDRNLYERMSRASLQVAQELDVVHAASKLEECVQMLHARGPCKRGILSV